MRSYFVTGWATGLFHPRQLSLGDVEVWRVSMKQRPAFIDTLSVRERARAQLLSDIQQKGWQTRKRFVLARGLLRRVLSTYLRVEAKHIDIDAHPNGKPFLSSGTGLQFNISHAGDTAVIAVSRGIEVGVDVELCKRSVASVDQLARRRLAPYEYLRLKAISEGNVEKMRSLFLELWTRKEAFVKCTGEGIARDLRSFEVSVDPAQDPKILKVDGCGEKAAQWSVHSLHTCVADENVFSSLVIASPEVSSLKVIDL